MESAKVIQMNADDLNWAAGMFEGEGTIRISRYRSPKGENVYTLRCKVSNTDNFIIDFFSGHWPGSTRPERPRGNQQPQRNWIVSGVKADLFLKMLFDHFRTERVKEKARLAIRFQKLKVLHSTGPNDECRSEQIECFECMKRLNLRGAAAKRITLEE